MVFIRAKKFRGKMYYYLVENRRVDGKTRQKVLKYLGKSKEIPSRKEMVKPSEILEKMKIVSVLDYGDVVALYKLCLMLKLREIINGVVRKGGGLDIGIQTSIMAINRCIDPVSKLRLKFWYEGTALPLLTNVKPNKLTSDSLYKCLDYLTDNRIAKIEKKIVDRLMELFNIRMDTLVYDITSTYFEGTKCEIAKKGYSRDHEPGKVQIEIGLVITRDGKFPVYHQVHEGNIGDVTTVENTAKRLKKTYPFSKCTLILDRGMISRENIHDMDDLTYDYICGLRKNLKEVQRLIKSIPIDEMMNKENIIQKLDENHNVYAIERIIEIYGKKRKVVVCLNEKKREKDKQRRDEKIQKAEKELSALSGKINTGIYKDIVNVAGRVNDILEGIKTYFPRKLTIKEDERIVFEYRKNTSKIEQVERFDGFYVLMSTNLDFPADEIIASYFSDKDKIEKAFKVIKDPIKVRPIYHWKTNRVKAHVFICILGYLLRTILDYILVMSKADMNANYALQLLHRIKLVALHFEGNYLSKMPKLSNEQKHLLEILGIRSI